MSSARLRLPARNSLFWRYAGWMTLGSVVLLSLVGAAMYLIMQAEIANVDAQVLTKRARRLADVLQTEQSAADWLGHEVSEDLEAPRQVFLRVLDARGAVVGETPGMERLASSRFQAPIPFGGRGGLETVETDGGVFRVMSFTTAAAGLPGGMATIQAAVDTRVDEALLASYRSSLLLLAAPAVLISAFFAAAIAARLLAPMREVARNADQISGEQPGRRLSYADRMDELRRLVDAFNGVLDRFERAQDGLRAYADTVAHEIRTPLNRMLMNAEIALRGAGTEADYRGALERHIEECQHLIELAQRLLFLARADSVYAPAREMLTLKRELETITSFFEASAGERGVALVLEAGTADASFQADRTLFQQAIANLIANALAHTPPGGRVVVRGLQGERGIEVWVEDTGGGISAGDLPRVFDRFYRGGQSLGRAEGMGLGLPITRAILSVHGGTITLESSPGEGTKVRTWWPAATIV